MRTLGSGTQTWVCQGPDLNLSAMLCCLMTLFSLAIFSTSPILCNEHTLIIWENFLKIHLGPRGPVTLALDSGWLFHLLSPLLQSKPWSHWAWPGGGGREPSVQGGALRCSRASLVCWLFSSLPPSLPSLLPALGLSRTPGNKPGSRFWFNKTKQGTLGWPFTVL